MLISRVRNFVIWQKLSEFQAEAWLLVAAWIWAISWHGGLVQTASTVLERAGHKSRAAWDFSSLGDYMRDSSHLWGSGRAHQPDQGEVSSWRFRQAKTVSRPPAFPVPPAFLQTRVFHQARGFQCPQGFYRPPDFQQTQGFLNPPDF